MRLICNSIDAGSVESVEGKFMNASRLNLAVLLLASVAPLALTATPAQAQQQIAIAAQPLDAALQQLMAQTGLLISYPSSLSTGKQSGRVSGETIAVTALSRLLEGTGLVYRQTGTNSFTLESAPQVADDAIQLGTLRVEGNGVGAMAGDGKFGDDNDRAAAADRPYRTPGSVARVGRAQIDRVPPSSTGDIFLSVPGVISASNRNGQSLDLNIRGLQGMGRVATLIDGASQQTSMYRGYGGTSSRTFIDPDLIGGVDISKGPSDSAYGAGAMGGVVNMRTLAAPDLVGEANGFGVRLKAGIADNSVERPPTGTRIQRFDAGGLTTQARNLSIAAAYRSDNFELVGGFVERRNGNYFAGTTGNDRTQLISAAGVVTDHPISLYKKGGEIFNTSRDTQAALAKGTVRFGDGHALELGYVRYDSKHGEEYPDANNPFSQWSWIEEAALSDVLSNVYTAKYRWNPSENPLVDLHAEGWLSDINDYWGAYDLRSRVNTKGADLWNTSVVGTGLGQLTLKYGGQYSVEKAATGLQSPPPWGDNLTFHGVRKIGRAYVNADMGLSDWAKLSGGLSYEFFRTRGNNWRNGPELGLSGSRLNPRAMFTLSPSDSVQIFAGYSQGWRPATLRETLLDMDSLIRPNPLLRPEKSRSIEYGVNVLQDGVIGDDRLKAKFVYFDNRYTDFIVREAGATFGLPTAYRTYTNIPEVRFRGLEASIDYTWRNLFLEGQLSYYTDVQFCQPTTENSFLPCARFTSGEDYGAQAVPPKYAGSVTIGGRFLSNRLTLGARTVFADARAIGRRAIYNGSSFNSEWAAYTVFDLFGSFDIGERLTLAASVENVGNRFYLDAISRARTPSPGRLFRMSLTGRFGGPERQRTRTALAHQSQLGTFDGNWSGSRVGLVSGYAGMTARSSVVRGDGAASAESGRFRDGGISLGLNAGHDWQLPSGLVLGLEGEFGKTTSKGSYNYVGTENANLVRYKNVEATYRANNEWQAGLRGRIGQGFGRLLLYATGGLAVLRDEMIREQFIAATPVANPSRTQLSFSETDRKTHLGWSAGLGGELAVSNRWSLRAEYLRSDFGNKTYRFDDARKGVLQSYTQIQYVVDSTGNLVIDPQTGNYQIISTPITGSASIVDGRRATRNSLNQAVRLGINYRF